MPKNCAVIECNSSSRMPGRKFFRFPIIQHINANALAITRMRQEMWLKALNRADFPPKRYKHATVCDRHFVSGRSAYYADVDNVDWVPTLNLGYETFKFKTEPIEREEPSSLYFGYETFDVNVRPKNELKDDDEHQQPDYLEEVTHGMDPDYKNVLDDGTAEEAWDSDDTTKATEGRPYTPINFVCVSVDTVSTQTDDTITGMSSDILSSYQMRIAALEAKLRCKKIKVDRC